MTRHTRASPVFAAALILFFPSPGVFAQSSASGSNAVVGTADGASQNSRSGSQSPPATGQSAKGAAAATSRSLRREPDPELEAISKAEREGRLLDAEKLVTAAVDKAESGSAPAWKLGQLLRSLAETEFRLRHFSEAIAAQQRIIAMDKTLIPPQNPGLVQDLMQLGGDQLWAGDAAAANRAFEQGLALARKSPGRNDEELVAALWRVGGIYEREHRDDDAKPLIAEAVKICESQQNPRAFCSYVLSGYYAANGHAGYAEEMLSNEAAQTPTGPGFRVYLRKASALDSLARQYTRDHSYDLAEASYRQAIAVIEAAAKRPLESAYEYNNLGQVLELEARDNDAEAAYKHALDLRENAPGPFRKQFIEDLADTPLVRLYLRQGRLSDAETFLQQALTTQEQALDPHDEHLADTLSQLANVYVREHQYSDAAPLLEQALKIREADYGPDSPQLIWILMNYAGVLRRLGETDKAQAVAARAAALRQKISDERHR